MAKRFDSQLKGYVNTPQSMKKDPTFPIYKLGYDQGKNDVRSVVLTHLENKYISAPDRPERNSDEAKYLLGLAKELAELIRGIDVGGQD